MTNITYQSEFTNLAERMGLTDDEYELAQIIWNKAVRCAEGKPLQEAALLVPNQAKKEAKPELTQRELQVLSSLLKSMINLLDSIREDVADEIEFLYEQCDKDAEQTEDSAEDFKLLNSYRTDQRAIKARLANLTTIQRKVKLLKGL